jgi:hypothetical protein
MGWMLLKFVVWAGRVGEVMFPFRGKRVRGIAEKSR